MDRKVRNTLNGTQVASGNDTKATDQVDRSRFSGIRTPYDMGAKQKLEILNKSPNFHYRWVIDGDPDRPGRLEEYKSFGAIECRIGEDGISVRGVSAAEGSVITKPAKGNSNARLVLCKMPIEIFNYHEEMRSKSTQEYVRSKNNAREHSNLSMHTDDREGA